MSISRRWLFLSFVLVTGGSSTPSPSAPSPPQTKKKCVDFKSCESCSHSSWECHWCSSDNTCHAKGSLKGCAAGANCHAIDRCQRLQPEEIEHGGTFSRESFQGVSLMATTVLSVIMGLILCCSTCCFVGVSCVKGVVEDIVRDPDADRSQHDDFLDDDRLELQTPLLENGDIDDTTESSSNSRNISDCNSNRSIEDDVLVTTEQQSSVTQLSISSVAVTRRHPSPPKKKKKKSSVKHMYGICQIFYLVTIFSTVILFIVGMSYAPRQPQYNVCTNQFEWKSIIEGMIGLKMSASFDLLISVYNPNRFEIDLNNGSGQFHHDGNYVGLFEIPQSKISGKAISDVVVKVTFSPDKWSAIGMTTEYYRGTLKFVIGGHANVQIPALGSYQFDAKFDDVIVNVNDPSKDDTHLCACPSWKKNPGQSRD
mmetsp:Transcript_6404/g.9395  ORF Transcript_6404/g.9395 Transcript_6404/m.9395 type:complete len:425 (-) Transcript_6404:62-1336(-)